MNSKSMTKITEMIELANVMLKQLLYTFSIHSRYRGNKHDEERGKYQKGPNQTSEMKNIS